MSKWYQYHHKKAIGSPRPEWYLLREFYYGYVVHGGFLKICTCINPIGHAHTPVVMPALNTEVCELNHAIATPWELAMIAAEDQMEFEGGRVLI
jgi:hypothetical protein